jgi:type II restriction/modification system DNA methylase subunit YeeA
MSATPDSLQTFVAYCKNHLRGDERGEAQIFLDRFFQAFGHEGVKEAGANYEERIVGGSQTGKLGFADLVWKKHVLIEMKKRGEDLTRREHRAQTERYYLRLKKEDRPRYVMMCNFDEFHIYDFDDQPEEPVDTIRLEELPGRIPAFSFMRLDNARPLFKNNQVEITEKAASRMGLLLEALIDRARESNFAKYSEAQAQRFVLQCVLAMFAEDRGLLPAGLFTQCVKDCIEGASSGVSSYDVLGGLFHAMNQKGITPDGRYEGVPYFNGGLFAEIHPIKLQHGELKILEACAEQQWRKVRPSIFGNIFESALKGKKQRHAHGIHFTSEGDIRRIVLPTITDYWEARIKNASTVTELQQLQRELGDYRVLDPACGSGNFLYVAYQELKQIEKDLLTKLRDCDSSKAYLPVVTAQNFYGMDINSFAVELAKVTLMIGRKVAIDDLQLAEDALPLDTLDRNIVCADALFTDWVKADAIIGNPPFLGGSRIRLELSDNYAEKLFKKFSNIRAQVDFSSYWFRLAHENLDELGRAGLVATNSISQGKSREVSLNFITQNGGYIHNAVSTQPWSGEAKVHVSIVNWSKQKPEFCELDSHIVQSINSSLQATIDVSNAHRLSANLNKAFVGAQPNSKGFFITEQQAIDWMKADPNNKNVLKQSSSAQDLTDNPNGKPDRWIIDFQNMSIEEISDYELPFKWVEEKVKPERIGNRETVLREKWWRFKRTNEAMRKALTPLNGYFIVPCHSKWFVFMPADTNWLANNSNTVVASDDFYVLGILTSKVHRLWVKAQSSTLEDRIRYTPTTCFETFPFPQTVEPKLIEKIRTAAQELHQWRSNFMETKQWGITALYNKFFAEPTSQLYQLHAKLDKLVLQAYGFQTGDDLLEKLLALNLELAEKEKRGEPVVGPWAPTESIE